MDATPHRKVNDCTRQVCKPAGCHDSMTTCQETSRVIVRRAAVQSTDILVLQGEPYGSPCTPSLKTEAPSRRRCGGRLVAAASGVILRGPARKAAPFTPSARRASLRSFTRDDTSGRPHRRRGFCGGVGRRWVGVGVFPRAGHARPPLCAAGHTPGGTASRRPKGRSSALRSPGGKVYGQLTQPTRRPHDP